MNGCKVSAEGCTNSGDKEAGVHSPETLRVSSMAVANKLSRREGLAGIVCASQEENGVGSWGIPQMFSNLVFERAWAGEQLREAQQWSTCGWKESLGRGCLGQPCLYQLKQGFLMVAWGSGRFLLWTSPPAGKPCLSQSTRHLPCTSNLRRTLVSRDKPAAGDLNVSSAAEIK